MIGFTAGFLLGVFLTLIISVNAYASLEDELIEEKENNRKLAKTIEEIRKEKEDGE